MGFRSLVAALILAAAAYGEVRVWQGTLRLATTQEGPPDPNPPFDIFATSRFNYPYTLRTNLTGEEQDIDWRALFLENEYLKCTVLPDIGGHLYTCIDKISGQPMFYANPTIKKAQIGYRGAWAAFGIEFNFPVSHNWVSMSPVDFETRTNPDGSASIVVGNTDLPYGMQWTVELRLKAASTLLEQRVTLYNRSDVRHRYYWWNNAGVRVWDDSVIWYPMRWSASHGFTNVDTWPVDSSGRDLSVIRNQTRGNVSRFVHGSREPFMGVYHPHTQTGVAHYAEYADLPGKKIWSWGVDPDGLDWRRALSDDNSAYVEVQAGLMRNQETYAFLEPREVIRFTEYWMPVRAIGGIARANLNGVVNLRREGERVIAGLNVNEAIAGAKIRLLDGNRVLHEETADLIPGKTWSGGAAIQPPRKATFDLRDREDHVLLRQTEGEYDWSPESEIHVGPQPQYAPTDPLEIGAQHELNGRLLQAYETYAAAPPTLAQQRAAGRLAVTLLRYDDALRYLIPAQQHATQDGEIAYYLGLAYEGLGRDRDARTQFEAAQRTPSFHGAGLLKLAETTARLGDSGQAARYLRTLPEDPRASEELAAIERRPLTQNFSHDAERVLDAAGLYMRLGLWREAFVVLSFEDPEATPGQRGSGTPGPQTHPIVAPEQKEPGVPLPQSHAMVQYFRAYCREKLGERPDYAAASRLPVAYVFPHGMQALTVLAAAVRANPSDATAHYLLGDLRLASGLVDAAIAEWNTARKLNPKIPVLDASLGRTLLHVKHDIPGALEAFRAGLGPDPANLDLYTGLEETLSIERHPAAELADTLERYPDRAHMPTALVYDLALAEAEAGRFAQAESLFQNRFFAREEGGTNVRQVWIRVRALEAQSLPCEAALPILDHLAEPVPQLAFTRDGLTPFLNEPANQAAFGSVEARCGRATAGRGRLAASGAFGGSLARELKVEWKPPAGRGGGGAYQTVIRGLVQLESGQKAEAIETLKSVFLMPNQNLAHHHARLILSTLH